MTGTIENALTPVEWHLLRLWKAGKMPGGKVRGMVVLGLPEEQVHGAAACALYGEPFGFTKEDVRFLRSKAASQDQQSAWADADLLNGLASRIAALLPPEENNG